MRKKAIEMKKEVVSAISEKMEKATSCIVVDYKGLTVEEDTNFRKQLRDANIDYVVYKNTMVRRAASNLGGFDKFDEENLVGPNGYVFGYADVTEPARIIKNFSKDHKNLEMRFGYVEGAYFELAQLEKLASIPSREVLIAKLLGSFKAPISNFVYLIKAIADKKAEEEGVTNAPEAASVAEEGQVAEEKEAAEANAPAESEENK